MGAARLSQAGTTALDSLATEPVAEPAARDDIAQARRVLGIEAAALARLADSLDGSFARALDLLASARGRGRVVTTGMGKSGHVARKIAATLASTGTPAIFVHPAEASHGDLGMVTGDDVVLALSNSGETAELNDIIEHAGRFHIPLVAIVGRAGSTMATRASVALVLPDAPEACPNGMAPTTSTTMALALGDALAVALVHRSGFTGADFRKLHPGGSLGARLRTVRDLMHVDARMPLVGPDAAMSEVLIEMTAKSFGCVGVVGEPGGRLLGIITDGDLRRHMEPALLSRRADAIMTPDPKVIAPRKLAAEALWIMSTGKITSLFVVEDQRPVGILHLHDCLRAGIA
jgi:arabinose-5-phosphate isomerase